MSWLLLLVFSPLAGWLYDRWGARLLVPAGGLLLGAALVLTGRVTTLWQYYLAFGVLGGAGGQSFLDGCGELMLRPIGCAEQRMRNASNEKRDGDPRTLRRELIERPIGVGERLLDAVSHHVGAQSGDPGLDRGAPVREGDDRRRALGESERPLRLFGLPRQHSKPRLDDGKGGVPHELVVAEPSEPLLQGLPSAVVVERQRKGVDQARDGVVSGNLVYSITSRGNPAYRNEENSDGIYVDGGTRILIERNVIHDVDFGIELASEHKDRATSYITARNNLIYHGHTAGVSIGGYAPERGHTEHCTVVNNTFYDNDTSGTGSGEFQMQWNMADNIFANNVVYAGPRCLIAVNKSQVDKNQPPVAIDHNLYYCASGTKASTWAGTSATVTGFDNYVESTGNDRHSRFLDPHFVDAAANDFHLRLDSPAIAAGTTDGVPVGELDLEGSPRVTSGKVDIGCYQRQRE